MALFTGLTFFWTSSFLCPCCMPRSILILLWVVSPPCGIPSWWVRWEFMGAAAAPTLWISLWALPANAVLHFSYCGLQWAPVGLFGVLLSVSSWARCFPLFFPHTDTDTVLAVDLSPSTCTLGIMGLPCHHFFFFFGCCPWVFNFVT